MRVREYMSSEVSTISEEAHLLEAALLIRRTGKRHIPVVNREGMLIGIITDRDVSRLAPSMLGSITPEEYNAVFETTPITSVMTSNPLTVTPETDLLEAVRLLHGRKIGALPVLETGKLVGILTRSDLLGLLHELLAEKSSFGAAG